MALARLMESLPLVPQIRNLSLIICNIVDSTYLIKVGCKFLDKGALQWNILVSPHTEYKAEGLEVIKSGVASILQRVHVKYMLDGRDIGTCLHPQLEAFVVAAGLLVLETGGD